VLAEKGIKVFKVYIGEFATSMEMAGASISLLKLDDELKALLSKPAHTPFFEQKQL
jgi:phosphoenolpyruvate---glycerone phosphotransferase subunit DhaK